MDSDRMLIIDFSADADVLYMDVAYDAKRMGAEHTQVLVPPYPVPISGIGQVIVAVFSSERNKQLYELTHGHTFNTLDPDDPGIEWFEQEWHRHGIPL